MSEKTVKVTMHKAMKYRIKDCGNAHEESPMRTFLMSNCGCSRKVYNLLVDWLYAELEKRGFENGLIPKDLKVPEVTTFKNNENYQYLKDADSLALANTLLDFKAAIKRYNDKSDHKSYTKRALRRDKSGVEPLSFRGLKGMPKFHSRRRGDVSYKTNCQTINGKSTVSLEGNRLHLPKMGKDGYVELVMHRPFPKDATIGNVTVSMDTDGEMYASIEYSYQLDMPMRLRDAAMSGNTEVLENVSILGLDYSQKDFYVDSEGRKANYPRYYTKSEEKLAKLQRQLARMQYDEKEHKGSRNYEKKRAEIAKLHTKIRNQRTDFLHKLSTELVSDYDVIAVEDIDLRAMGESLTLGKNLHDNGLGMFREMLAYKLETKGSVLVKVDRMYASTKTCHKCGYKNPDVVLGVSKWVCPECGAEHDRDYNAALNIRDEGLRILPEYYANWIVEDEAKRRKAKALSDGRKKKKTA